MVSELAVWLAQLDDADLRNPSGGQAALDRAAFPIENPLAARLHALPYLVGNSVRRAASALDGVALCLSLSDPIPCCHSLCRVALDTVSRTFLILDPSCSASERGARTASAERAARREQRNLVLADPKLLSRADAKLANFESGMTTAGLRLTSPPKYTTGVGMLIGLGNPAVGEDVYRALSAASHGSWHGVSSAPVFSDPLSLAGPALLGVLDTLARLIVHIDWDDAEPWYRWAARHRTDLY
jgi:hypothetical protein